VRANVRVGHPRMVKKMADRVDDRTAVNRTAFDLPRPVQRARHETVRTALRDMQRQQLGSIERQLGRR
jgi:hypothetical protein